MWDYLDIDSLPFHCILVDLPGHGLSALDDRDEPPSLHYYAEKVKGCLRNLNVLEYHIVGHSMGGYVALILKESDPGCKKVVLLNSNFWDDSEQKKRDRIRVADLAFSAKEHLIRNAIPGLFVRPNDFKIEIFSLIEEALRLESEAIAFAALAMRNRENMRRLIKKYLEDFLIVHGAKDPLVSCELLEEKLFGLNIHTIILEHAGHMAHLEEPDLVVESLVRFLS